MKSDVKLNNNLASPKKWHGNYNPTCDYDYIFKTVTHNMNCCTKKADDDAAADGTTWQFDDYCGEVSGRLVAKPKDKSAT